MRIDEISTRPEDDPKRGPSWKAGGFPFVVQDGTIHVCLVTSTDPAYGGPDPMIPKGRADFGEQPEVTAAREVYEETGIGTNHIKRTIHVTTEVISGLTRSYDFHVYAFELNSMVPPIANREAVGHWYDLEKAQSVIRRSHKPLLDKFVQKIRSI